MSAADLSDGMALLQAGRWDEGIARLQRVVEEQPQFAEVCSNLGFALLQARRPEEARAALERAVAVKPELADAWNLIGLMELDASHYREGVAALERRAVQMVRTCAVNCSTSTAGPSSSTSSSPSHLG